MMAPIKVLRRDRAGADAYASDPIGTVRLEGNEDSCQGNGSAWPSPGRWR